MYLGELKGMSMSKLLFYCNRKAITCTEFEKWSIHPVRLVYLIYSPWQLVSVEIPDQWELFLSWNKKRRQSGPCWPLKENKEKSHWFRSSISELIFFLLFLVPGHIDFSQNLSLISFVKYQILFRSYTSSIFVLLFLAVLEGLYSHRATGIGWEEKEHYEPEYFD